MSKPDSPPPDPATDLSLEPLFVELYEELRVQAREVYSTLAKNPTCDPTGLLHETFLALQRRSGGKWESAEHFRAVANMALRRLAIDHYRSRNRQKRGGAHQRMPLEDFDAAAPERSTPKPQDLILMDELLTRLSEEDARAAQIVQMRVYEGKSEGECAEELGISERTVRRDWAYARAWLSRETGRASGGEEPS